VRGREIDEHHLLTLAHAGENDRSAHVR
jgi:hypothetical protein